MKALHKTIHGALALLVAVSACGDDNSTTPGIDASCPVGVDAAECPVPVTSYRQVEMLGRPGIAEALLLSNGFIDAYNSAGPFFTGVDPAAVGMVIGEAKTVLRAIHYGVCLLNGVAGFTPANGAKPGGVQCAATGGGIFTENSAAGVTLTQATKDAATMYADRVFGQFVTDVMRIDTAVASGYLTLCGTAATGEPLLCGGRKLNDDVIDITYFYLLAGAAVPSGTTTLNTPQVVALVTDGVFFSGDNTENSGIGFGTPDTNNPNQFKQSCPNCAVPKISTTFPYSAPPL